MPYVQTLICPHKQPLKFWHFMEFWNWGEGQDLPKKKGNNYQNILCWNFSVNKFINYQQHGIWWLSMVKYSLNPFSRETETVFSLIAWSVKKVQATQMTLSKKKKVIPSTCIWERVSDCGCVGWVWDCIWKWNSHSLCMCLCECWNVWLYLEGGLCVWLRL